MKVKKQLAVRRDINVTEHERLSNITQAVSLLSFVSKCNIG
jgi:hypothetical protein